MVDIENDDSVRCFVDAVADAVLTASSTPESVEWCSQGNSDDAGSLREWTDDELPGRESSIRWKRLAEGPSGAGRQDDLVAIFGVRVTRHGVRGLDAAS